MILSEMRHPNIVRLYGVFVEEEYLYVVTGMIVLYLFDKCLANFTNSKELMRGKDLFDRIEKKARQSNHVNSVAVHSVCTSHRVV
jgi:serine/threonine protein kinase